MTALSSLRLGLSLWVFGFRRAVRRFLARCRWPRSLWRRRRWLGFGPCAEARSKRLSKRRTRRDDAGSGGDREPLIVGNLINPDGFVLAAPGGMQYSPLRPEQLALKDEPAKDKNPVEGQVLLAWRGGGGVHIGGGVSGVRSAPVYRGPSGGTVVRSPAPSFRPGGGVYSHPSYYGRPGFMAGLDSTDDLASMFVRGGAGTIRGCGGWLGSFVVRQPVVVAKPGLFDVERGRCGADGTSCGPTPGWGRTGGFLISEAARWRRYVAGAGVADSRQQRAASAGRCPGSA